MRVGLPPGGQRFEQARSELPAMVHCVSIAGCVPNLALKLASFRILKSVLTETIPLSLALVRTWWDVFEGAGARSRFVVSRRSTTLQRESRHFSDTDSLSPTSDTDHHSLTLQTFPRWFSRVPCRSPAPRRSPPLGGSSPPARCQRSRCAWRRGRSTLPAVQCRIRTRVRRSI